MHNQPAAQATWYTMAKQKKGQVCGMANMHLPGDHVIHESHGQDAVDAHCCSHHLLPGPLATPLALMQRHVVLLPISYRTYMTCKDSKCASLPVR